MRPERIQQMAKPETRRPHLRVVATETEPPTGRSFVVLMSTLVVIAMLLAGGVVYLWQHGQVTDAQRAAGLRASQLTAVQRELASAHEQFVTAGQGRRAVADRLDRFVGRRTALAARIGRMDQRVTGLQAEVTAQQQKISTVEGRLAAMHARALMAAGPVLTEGRYLGRIEGVDGRTTPGRLAISVESRMGPPMLRHPGWRLFPVAPNAMLALATWKDGDVVPFATFEHIFDGQAPWNAKMRDVTYRIALHDGTVTSIAEYA